jgi:hypothetical protein
MWVITHLAHKAAKGDTPPPDPKNAPEASLMPAE